VRFVVNFFTLLLIKQVQYRLPCIYPNILYVLLSRQSIPGRVYEERIISGFMSQQDHNEVMDGMGDSKPAVSDTSSN